MTKHNATGSDNQRRELLKEIRKLTYEYFSDGVYDDILQAVDTYVAERERNVDRFEVVDETGRAYVKGSIYGSPVTVELSYQDQGRTLKVFVRKRLSQDSDRSEVKLINQRKVGRK